MSKINPHNFHIPTSSTSPEINNKIALNQIRKYRLVSDANLTSHNRRVRPNNTECSFYFAFLWLSF
jgi:hypothetical protein